MYLGRYISHGPGIGRAAAHVGSRRDFAARYENEARHAAADPRLRSALLCDLLDLIGDTRNLRLAWDHVATCGGPEPGPDGLHCADLIEPEVWELLRALGRAVRDGTYRPGRTRCIDIPKASGRGTRRLTLLELPDRVVQRAAVQILQPLLDPLFADGSLGYRPGRGREHALARAEALAVRLGRWSWVVEDLRTAFDRVPRCRLLNVVRHYLPDDRLMCLIGRVVRTPAGRGLCQGGALSPLMLNVYLHHLLDSWWLAEFPDVPLIRVADDLLVLAASHAEARAFYGCLCDRLVSIGMEAKHGWDLAVHDLGGRAHADWLGYRLRRGDGGLVVEIAPAAWSTLELHLGEAHKRPGSPVRAQETVRAWLDQLGPAHAHARRPDVYGRVARLARDAAFEELPGVRELDAVWQSAARRWDDVRRQTVLALAPQPAGAANAAVPASLAPA
jgi:hypothetical protein